MAGQFNSINWGILGTGWVAQRFAQDLATVPGARLVALASRSLERAQEFALRVGRPHAYGSYRELVEDPAVHVVYIATPHSRHRDDCLMALEAGKAVLCEKPFTVNASQAREVRAVARRLGLFCMEAMWMRFVPAMSELRRIVGSGRVGEVQFLSADFGVPTDRDPANRFFNPSLGGGALLDRGIYALSLAFWLLGTPTEVVARAHFGRMGVDETCSILLRFGEDRLALLSATLVGYASNEAVVVGSNGRIRVHEPLCRPSKLTLDHASTFRPTQAWQMSRSGLLRLGTRAIRAARHLCPWKLRRSRVVRLRVKGFGYSHEAREVVSCLMAGLKESPVMPLDETVAIMEVLDEVRRQSVGSSSC